MGHQLDAACSITRALQSQLRVRRLHVEASLMDQLLVHIDEALEARRLVETAGRRPEIGLPGRRSHDLEEFTVPVERPEGRIYGLSSQTSATVATCIRQAIELGNDVAEECQKQFMEREASDVMQIVKQLGDIGPKVEATMQLPRNQRIGLEAFLRELDRSVVAVRSVAAALEGCG